VFTEPGPLGSCRANAPPSLPEEPEEPEEPSEPPLPPVGDGLGNREDTVGGGPPSEVNTTFGLDVGVGGGAVGAGGGVVGAGGGAVDAGGGVDGLEDEENTVGGTPPSEVNTKFGLDDGAGGGAVGILVEPVLSTVGPELGGEFIPS
jgi:hypothetical protein